ncbi:MAG: hypothetical protein H0X39_07960 [Actinobacteria bacterium]|nr:hypothetical protein [Actinomycetota bacterium]
MLQLLRRVIARRGLLMLLTILVTALAVSAGLIVFGRSGADAAPDAASAEPARSAFPAPPRGAVVYSRELGYRALALGVVPKPGGVLVQASVLGRQGEGVRGLQFTFTAGGHTSAGIPCGAGCYDARLPISKPRQIEVRLRGNLLWRVDLPAAWPPRNAATLVARAERVFRSLHSVSFRESLASSPHERVVSSWRVQAPDRVAYQTNDGWAGIVIGSRRWDRAPGKSRWETSAQTRLTQPVPFWVSVTDAHVLGSVMIHGRPVWRISFFDPGSPAWFEITIDRPTMRTVDSRMVTTAHFMHDTYSLFNATPAIVPPR